MKSNPDYRIYRIWTGIKTRCYDTKSVAYPWYGKRGITMCDRWHESFENFLSDMGLPPSNKHSIDRIDNDGNYEPGNCRWATKIEQGRNTRRKRMVRAFGDEKGLSEWLEDPRCAVAQSALIGRLDKGWPAEKAIASPPGTRLAPTGRWDKAYHVKLTWAGVREIRRRAAAGECGAHIAKDFGISKTTSSKVIKGTIWPASQDPGN